MAGMVVIAALFAFVVVPPESDSTGGASTNTVSSVAPGPKGGGLLVVEQEGKTVEAALVYAGSNDGVVLAIPGVTLLRSGDRFAPIAQLATPDQPAALSDPVSDALAVPVEAVASITWKDLRDSLSHAGIEALPPLVLDPTGADAAGLATALAALMSKGGTVTGGADWDTFSLGGDAEGFRAVLAAARAANPRGGWTGQAVSGLLNQEGDSTYLEPDLDEARDVLGVTEGKD
jgi:hypothetical protein